MSQVGKYITGPYQGVTQAPQQVRLEEQADALDNCHVAIPQGLTKRPPFVWEATLGGASGDTNGVCHVVERDGTNDFLLTMNGEVGLGVVPRLYALNGLPRGYEPGGYAPVALTIETAAQDYLDYGAPDPQTEYSVLTVEDYTFILNRKVVVDQSPDFAPARPFEGMIWVRQSAYARTYTITVTPEVGTPVTATLHTPNGTSASDGDFVDTDRIANQLAAGSAYTTVNGASFSGQLTDLVAQGFAVDRTGSVIYLASNDTNFTIKVEDGQAGEAMVAVKDKVQSFSDLPKKSFVGFTVRIAQQSGTNNDDFFVQYQEAAGPGSGIWQEVIGPGASLGFRKETMPVGLVFDGGWQLKVLPWKPRECGDEMLAPDPDFVGSVLRDITFWRGRLALISGEAVTLSSAEDPFRFYPRTLATIVDSDPVSLISPAPNKSTFRYAVEFDERLIVFGDKAQAAVSANGVLTLDTASIGNAADYEFAGLARPEASGERVYFVAPRGTGSVVFELRGDQDGNGRYRLAGDDMTAAIPKYVPPGINRVASCRVNYLITYGQSGGDAIFPHLFRYSEGQRVQNAWERWWLPQGFTLGGMFFRNTTLCIIACRDGKSLLCSLDLAPDTLDEGSTRMMTHLDLRLTEAQTARTFDALTDTTLVAFPYFIPDDAEVAVSVRAPGGVGGPSLSESGPEELPEGFLADITGRSFSTVTLNGNWVATPLHLGLRYTQLWRLNIIYPLDQSNQPIRSGRCSLGKLVVDVADTGYLKALVTPTGRETRSYEFTGYILGDPTTQLDQAPSATDTFTVPVRANTEKVRIEFQSDSHFGSKVLGFYWQGNLNQKAGRP